MVGLNATQKKKNCSIHISPYTWNLYQRAWRRPITWQIRPCSTTIPVPRISTGFKKSFRWNLPVYWRSTGPYIFFFQLRMDVLPQLLLMRPQTLHYIFTQWQHIDMSIFQRHPKLLLLNEPSPLMIMAVQCINREIERIENVTDMGNG